MTGLIINGDDLGMNERCSRAVAKAFELGLITHTSAMANGEYIAQALELARSEGFFDRIGVHFNLTEGEPLTGAVSRIPDFVKDGRFHKGFLQAPRTLTQAEREAVAAELTAQARLLADAGVVISHADSHHYIHTLAELAPLTAQVCRDFGIPRIRLNRTFDIPGRPRVTLDRIDNGYWREQGFETAEHFGRLSDVMELGVPENTEIMVHPDFDILGRLIDRHGMEDGHAEGSPLSEIAELN